MRCNDSQCVEIISQGAFYNFVCTFVFMKILFNFYHIEIWQFYTLDFEMNVELCLLFSIMFLIGFPGATCIPGGKSIPEFWLGAIPILRQQKERVGGVRKMAIFADVQYYLCWCWVGGSEKVHKSSDVI